MPELLSASPVFFCYSIIEQLLQKDALARASWNTEASPPSASAPLFPRSRSRPNHPQALCINRAHGRLRQGFDRQTTPVQWLSHLRGWHNRHQGAFRAPIDRCPTPLPPGDPQPRANRQHFRARQHVPIRLVDLQIAIRVPQITFSQAVERVAVDDQVPPCQPLRYLPPRTLCGPRRGWRRCRWA